MQIIYNAEFYIFNTLIGCLKMKIDCYMASLLSNFVNKVDSFFFSENA